MENFMIVEECMYVQQCMLKLRDESYEISEHKRVVTQAGHIVLSSAHLGLQNVASLSNVVATAAQDLQQFFK